MKIVIVIPTYNEKDNINYIFSEISKFAPKSEDLSILFVDDNSPDGTADIIKTLQKKHKNIHLLSGEKNGLGAAYVRGFDYAIKELNADLIFEMDADGSHKPKYIPNMIKAIKDGADVAVGTRYIKGGSIPSDWGLHRKIQSALGNIIARIILLAPQFHDMTTGFRATKSEYLNKVDYHHLFSNRFSYKMHLFYALYKSGAKITEVPIDFIDREKGHSKIQKNEIIDSLRVVILVSLKYHAELIKFLITGVIGYLVNAITLSLATTIFRGMVPTGALTNSVSAIKDSPLFMATLLSGEMSIITIFLINNFWTFRYRKVGGSIFTRFLKFNLTALGSPVIQIIVINTLTPYFGIHKQISLAIGVILGLVLNWFLNTKVVWRKKTS